MDWINMGGADCAYMDSRPKTIDTGHKQRCILQLAAKSITARGTLYSEFWDYISIRRTMGIEWTVGFDDC